MSYIFNFCIETAKVFVPKLLFLNFFPIYNNYNIKDPIGNKPTGFMGYPGEQCLYFCKQCFHKNL